MVRKAVYSDIDAVSDIYEKIHTEEEQNKLSIGWIRGVYPSKETAVAALERDDLFVYEENGRILASAIINKSQVDVYADGNWTIDAPDDKVMVLHTLTVSPKAGKHGIGRKFVDFYERYAFENGCTVLRMDTNEINAVARSFYKKLGFREVGIVPCVFNKIPNVKLVLLEKKAELDCRS